MIRLLSIIVPTLNEEMYIGRLLVSLAVQDFKDFELIIVDADSSDLTKEKAKRYAGYFYIDLKFVQANQKNISLQRNMGAAVARGEKLVFADADIELPTRNYLSRINRALAYRKSAAVLVRVRPELENFKDRMVSNFLNSLMLILNRIGIANGRGAVIGARADEFRLIGGFNESMTVAEDVDLFMRMKKFGRMGIITTPVHESPRRYRKKGYASIISIWIINGAWGFLFKKTLLSGWEDVR